MSDDPDLCHKCKVAQRLGKEAEKGESPLWCGSCNFENNDGKRWRRMMHDIGFGQERS